MQTSRLPAWPPRWHPTAASLAGVLLTLLVAIRIGTCPARPHLPPANTPIRVERVIDGDTLLLADGTRIRLLAVNTPETKHPTRPSEPYGEEAHSYTRSRVEGQLVRLSYDRERWDTYRRVLAYVTEPSGDLLNRELIRQGYSPAILTFPIRADFAREFQQLEAMAKREQWNLWESELKIFRR